MSEVTLIYPHQLLDNHPALDKGRPVYLIEEPLLLTYNPIHRQKLLFHLKTLDYYEQKLRNEGYTSFRILIQDCPTSEAVFEKIKRDGVDTVHVMDSTDDYLERALDKSGLNRIFYESRLFYLTKAEAVSRYQKSNKFMANFYREIRKDFDILVDDQKKPIGGKWSFDSENQKRVPKSIALLEDILVAKVSPEDENRLKSIQAEQYGETGSWLPHTHIEARLFLTEFLKLRFNQFGDYEDAILNEHTRLWHSTLSPLLNIGLLTPQEVINECLVYARKHSVPLNSLEGFVRQIIGWREFIRASYECDGRKMRQQNFFNHQRKIPDGLWTGETDLLPIDQTVTKALKTGYTHHIERLMIIGNFLLLTETDPNEVYRWFMGLYIDAYDWVMVPNVYGMSQFADGGSFATKPYISGGNYLAKMSDLRDDKNWMELWTALYWNFLDKNQPLLKNNFRMSLIYKQLERMSPEKLQSIQALAKQYLVGN